MTDGTTAEQRAEAARAEQERRLALVPTGVLRSARRYDELRKMGDAELQEWIKANPCDAARISAAADKRRRKAESREGDLIAFATPEEASHAAG